MSEAGAQVAASAASATGPTPAARLVVVPGPDDVAATACRLVLEAEGRALARSGIFRVALAGGSTPRRLYRLLAASGEASFRHWQVFFGDERWAPKGHAYLNATMAREALLNPAGFRTEQVHPIDLGAGSPARAAFLYEFELRRRLAARPGAMPCFDLVLLGLGADGHTASLFPGSSALEAARGEAVVATWAPAPEAWRVTLTAEAINAAREVVFLVSGADKAEALRGVLEPGARGDLPAALIRPPLAPAVFVADEAAAGLLDLHRVP
ncbi:MAG: 6-phosphogluconolactonase [Candidatus Binatia bacterium]